jgi:hypothetical protein
MRKTLAGLTAAAILAGGVALAGAGPASAATCTTTYKYENSTTAKGTVSQERLKKVACGHDYQEWMQRTTAYYTGAYSKETLYKDELAYPHWWSHEVLQHWTKTGTYSITVTNKSA